MDQKPTTVGMSEEFNIFPIPTGFILSYLQGFLANKTFIGQGEKSAAWNMTYGQMCGMICSQAVCVISPQDREMLWNSFAYGPPSADFLQPRVQSLRDSIQEYRQRGYVCPCFVDYVKFWVYYLRTYADASEKCQLFAQRFTDGEVTKAAPGLFFGPDAAEGNPAYWKTMQITGIETGSAIYGGGLTKYHDVKPTKAFLVHGCNKKENSATASNSSTTTTAAPTSNAVVEFMGGNSFTAAPVQQAPPVPVQRHSLPNANTHATMTRSNLTVAPQKRKLVFEEAEEVQESLPVKKKKLEFID